jgi:hypothetical protein
MLQKNERPDNKTANILQSDGKTPSFSDLLNNIERGRTISFLTAISILLLIKSGPTALFGFRVEIMSMTSCSKTIKYYFPRDNSHDDSSKLFKQNQQLDFYVQNTKIVILSAFNFI